MIDHWRRCARRRLAVEPASEALMLNSDLVFNVLAAAAAFGAVVVLAPSAARTDAPAGVYAGGSAEPSDIRNHGAIFAETEESNNVRKTSMSQGNARLQAIGNARPR
jgi:hypothetical protein